MGMAAQARCAGNVPALGESDKLEENEPNLRERRHDTANGKRICRQN